MGLSRISSELQFGKPQASPHMMREGSAFIEGNRKLEGGQRKQRVAGFSLAESLPGKKSRLSSSYWALLSVQGMRMPPSGLLFNGGFYLLIFHTFYLLFY